MKIFCFTCKEHVLNTTDKFVLGGPYSGEMFEPVQDDGYWGNMFHHSATGGDMFCPRCEGLFIENNELLTEYGIIRNGQRTVDKSFSIVAPPGHVLPGSPMGVEYSRETADETPIAESLAERVTEADRVSELAEHNQIMVDSSDDPIGQVVEQIGPDRKDASILVCPKCGKTYKNKGRGPYFYDRHVDECEGQ